MENPGFGRDVARESAGELTREPEKLRKDAKDGDEEDESPEPEDPTDDDGDATLSEAQGTTGVASTASSTPDDKLGGSDLTQSGSTQSTSIDTSTQAQVLCGAGERHCYLLDKVSVTRQFETLDGKGPSLAPTESGMALVQYINGSAGPFEGFVRFGNRSILGMQSGIVVSDLGVMDFFGVDFVIRKFGCANGATRCAFAQVDRLVLSADVKNKRLICSYFGADKVALKKEVDAPMSASGVDRVGCGVLGKDLVLFVNGKVFEALMPEPDTNLVQVRVNFGSGFSFFDGKSFFGDVGMVRYWSDRKKMQDALSDG